MVFYFIFFIVLNNSRFYCRLINKVDKNDKSIKYDNEYIEENIKNLIG